MDEEKVEEVISFFMQTLSLETPAGEDEDTSLADFIADKKALTPDRQVHNCWRSEELDEMLKSLTDREERVIRLRFGLMEDRKARTLEEVGKELQVTRERARQIEAKALRKLRRLGRVERFRVLIEDIE